MRVIQSAILIAAFAVAVPTQVVVAFQQAPSVAPKDQMFSGAVTAISESAVTVARAGSGDSKTFLITSETRVEGSKPQVNSRVTIRYVASEQGDRAVRIIVRGPEKK